MTAFIEKRKNIYNLFIYFSTFYFSGNLEHGRVLSSPFLEGMPK
jgi:hypothetical protein